MISLLISITVIMSILSKDFSGLTYSSKLMVIEYVMIVYDM